MVRAVDPSTFQPKIGFKTRYGMVANPFAEGLNQGLGRLAINSNVYYRRVQVKNLMWEMDKTEHCKLTEVLSGGE